MIRKETTPEELALVLEEGEGYTLEFKQNVNADLSKELVAFANASGGRIFIGVDDANQVVGCDFSNALFSRIETMAAACDPPVAIFIEKLPDRKIIVIHVPEGANRPHRCTKGFYLRNGASSQKMSTADITAFIQSEGKVRFDQQLRMDLDWETTLDQSRLDHFLSLAGITQKSDTQNLLLNLGAGDMKNNQFYLNQTGMLFFAREPALRQPFVNVVCALFKGNTKAYILDRKELTGNILENVEEALLFLKSTFSYAGKSPGTVPAEKRSWNCPRWPCAKRLSMRSATGIILSRAPRSWWKFLTTAWESIIPAACPKDCRKKTLAKKCLPQSQYGGIAAAMQLYRENGHRHRTNL